MTAHRAAFHSDVSALIALWAACDLTQPHNDPAKDIALAMEGPNSAILLMEDAGSLLGSVMVGHDGHRGWVYYVAVHPNHQRKGLGRALMAAAETWLAERKIWKSMLMIRETNTVVRNFYAKLGYNEEPRTVMSRAIIDPNNRP